jgi:nicotinamide-nucleotide amidase
VFGRGEGWIEDRLGDLERELPGLVLGFRAALPEIQVKLRASGEDPAHADRIVAEAEQRVRERLGDVVFSDGEALPAVVLRLLIERKLTLAAAESCTGGLLGATLTDVPGSSAAFLLSAVTYADAMKEQVLGVPHEILQRHGAVSGECARAMAEGARRISNAALAVSITGIAGPDGGSFEKPVGLVFLALAHPGGCQVTTRKFRGRQREAIRALAAFTALDLVRRHLLGLPPLGPPEPRPASAAR